MCSLRCIFQFLSKTKNTQRFADLISSYQLDYTYFIELIGVVILFHENEAEKNA